MADAESPKFGNYLRAARLGFHWYAPMKRYVRMADDGPERIVITICTPSSLPSTGGRDMYRCWWEGDQESLLGLCPALRTLKLTNGLTESAMRFREQSPEPQAAGDGEGDDT